MGATTRWIVGSATTVALGLGTFYHQVSDQDPPEPSGVCWADTAMSMRFVREDGQNEGEWVERFQSTTNTPPGSAWCGSFSYWALQTCGKQPEGKPSKFAWVPSWADETKRVSLANAKPGDMLLIWFNSKGRYAHMGVVLRNNGDGSLVTVEGNTDWRGSRDGSGVHIRLRWPSSKDGIYRW